MKIVFAIFLFCVGIFGQTDNIVLKNEGRIIYLRHGKNKNVKVGAYYKTYREKVLNIDNLNRISKKLRNETSIVRIVEVREKFSIAKVIKNKGLSVRDYAIIAPYQSRVAVTGGFAIYTFKNEKNTKPYMFLSKSGYITPDYSKFYIPPAMYGGYIGLEMPKIQDSNFGVKYIVSFYPSCGNLEGYSMDLSGYYRFFTPGGRFEFPVGMGLLFSKIGYTFNYNDYNIANSESYVKQFFYGFKVFSGTRLVINPLFSIFLNIGFTYQYGSEYWLVRYKTGHKNSVFGYDTKKYFKLHEGYLPVKNVNPLGLDLKMGISFAF